MNKRKKTRLKEKLTYFAYKPIPLSKEEEVANKLLDIETKYSWFAVDKHGKIKDDK